MISQKKCYNALEKQIIIEIDRKFWKIRKYLVSACLKKGALSPYHGETKKNKCLFLAPCCRMPGPVMPRCFYMEVFKRLPMRRL